MTNRAVPRMTEVIPGAIVNIVLKADQRTGREVSGTVRDVLTKGDHHRGIKVRLTDGRIGRVQSMNSAASASSADSSSTILGSPAPLTNEPMNPMDGAASHPRGHRPRYRDVRLDEPLEAPPEQTDLSAYIVPGRRRGKGKNKNDPKEASQLSDSARDDGALSSNGVNSATDVTSATATCPVCGGFEGDETAVAHHVASHFE
ncbi:hypothetical protein F4819DRAFT_498300 [Hypoxylon fuscum]|nr:hypothetical protein F4819DRAFT_498300 [Hypoxylon fuscum]